MLNGVVCTVNEVVADHETKLQALLQQWCGAVERTRRVKSQLWTFD